MVSMKAKASFTLLGGFCLIFANLLSVHAQQSAPTLGATGLALPRFVSLKSNESNVRVGPSRNYSVAFIYHKKGMPVEITQEYDNWRRIRDKDGDEGWVYQSLLSGKRTAIVAPWARKAGEMVSLFSAPDKNSALKAQIEPNAIGDILLCKDNWCQLSFNGTVGYVDQTYLWGVYPNEVLQ